MKPAPSKIAGFASEDFVNGGLHHSTPAGGGPQQTVVTLADGRSTRSVSLAAHGLAILDVNQRATEIFTQSHAHAADLAHAEISRRPHGRRRRSPPGPRHARPRLLERRQLPPARHENRQRTRPPLWQGRSRLGLATRQRTRPLRQGALLLQLLPARVPGVAREKIWHHRRAQS